MVSHCRFRLLSGFLKFNVQGNAMLYISYYVENFFTIALVEELIFRTFLTQAVAFGPFQTFQWKELWGVLVSSVLFGVWHWPRETELENKLLYGVFATLAGVIYAFAYRTSNNILSPMLLHALVDTVWGALLHT